MKDIIKILRIKDLRPGQLIVTDNRFLRSFTHCYLWIFHDNRWKILDHYENIKNRRILIFLSLFREKTNSPVDIFFYSPEHKEVCRVFTTDYVCLSVLEKDKWQMHSANNADCPIIFDIQKL